MAWDYAELSKKAKEMGGPEMLVEKVFTDGKAAGKVEMYPVVAGALALGVGATAIINHFVNKARKTKEEAAKAKQELIQGIKDYDAAQDNKVNTETVEDAAEAEKGDSTA